MQSPSRSKKAEESEKENDPHRQSSAPFRQLVVPKRSKLFSDAIQVSIPINVTVDLRIAIIHTKQKRIKRLYKKFPSLNDSQQQASSDGKATTEEQAQDEDAASAADGEEGEDEENKEKNKNSTENKKKKKKLAHVPQPEQYGSVIDYLEAKYVRGVQLGDDEEDGDIVPPEDGSEGHGSVYSQGSFLDDTGLQRDVAEQVMANTTLTKLELEEDDADFFVNVGTLEVEDDQYGEHYDPLQEKEQTATKKRKKPTAAAKDSGTTPSKKKKPNKDPGSAKSKKSTSSQSTKKTTGGGAKGETDADDEQTKAAKEKRATIDGIFKKMQVSIKKMDDSVLPRKQITKLKVSVMCPANKNPGDSILFNNPHNPGQKLKAKVPKNCSPGDSFKVSVPVKQAKEDKDAADCNKIPRDFQELLDDYARAYDDWCQAEAQVNKSFTLFKEKQNKFDKVVKEFPKNLVVPIDAPYLKKLLRRARQNRLKRKKTASLYNSEGGGIKTEGEEGAEVPAADDPDEKDEKLYLDIPGFGAEFSSKIFNTEDFNVNE